MILNGFAKTLLPVAAIACLAGCKDDSTGPAETLIDGIRYTAVVSTIQSTNGNGSLSVATFSVNVTLENTTSLQVTRTYPVGCPVRLRLYRLGASAPAFDETKRACASETPATIAIPGGTSKTLSTGTRIPSSILGDSLAGGTYTVRAVVTTEGSRVVEVAAGSYSLVPPT